jgi:hypothetical protein
MLLVTCENCIYNLHVLHSKKYELNSFDLSGTYNIQEHFEIMYHFSTILIVKLCHPPIPTPYPLPPTHTR